MSACIRDYALSASKCAVLTNPAVPRFPRDAGPYAGFSEGGFEKNNYLCKCINNDGVGFGAR